MPHGTYNPTVRLQMQYTEDVSRGKFVGYDGKKAGAGELAAGVADQDWSNGDLGNVVQAQTALVKIKAVLTAGTLIASDNEGDGVAATDGDYAMGILLAGGFTGDFCAIDLMHSHLL
jgi:hypothetical protein